MPRVQRVMASIAASTSAGAPLVVAAIVGLGHARVVRRDRSGEPRRGLRRLGQLLQFGRDRRQQPRHGF